MSAPSRLARQLTAKTRATAAPLPPSLCFACRQCRPPARQAASIRAFSSTPAALSTSPSSFPPLRPSPVLFAPLAPQAATLSDAEYHELADEYLDRLLAHLEAMQDAREDVDVEYSSGVLTLALTSPSGTRTYVINKQPPNKQIWLSSPKSGPKRYDWVVGEGGEEGGHWIYLKDGSSLNELFREEIGLDLDAPEGEEHH